MAEVTTKRVHVTLNRSLLGQTDQLARARDRIVAVSGMRDVDEHRLQRYGVLSGTVDIAKLPAIHSVDDVTAVDVDQLKYAI
jgi:hypothetical protein